MDLSANMKVFLLPTIGKRHCAHHGKDATHHIENEKQVTTSGTCSQHGGAEDHQQTEKEPDIEAIAMYTMQQCISASRLHLSPACVGGLHCCTHAGIVGKDGLLQREGDASRGVKVRPGSPGRGGVVGPVTPSTSSQPILKEHA